MWAWVGSPGFREKSKKVVGCRESRSRAGSARRPDYTPPARPIRPFDTGRREPPLFCLLRPFSHRADRPLEFSVCWCSFVSIRGSSFSFVDFFPAFVTLLSRYGSPQRLRVPSSSFVCLRGSLFFSVVSERRLPIRALRARCPRSQPIQESPRPFPALPDPNKEWPCRKTCASLLSQVEWVREIAGAISETERRSQWQDMRGRNFVCRSIWEGSSPWERW